MATVPLVYAAVGGLLLNLAGWTVPEPLLKVIHLLAQASVPVMLVVLGLNLFESFDGNLERHYVPALATATVTKLILAPALAWLAVRLLGLPALSADVTVLQSAMPTAVVTTILASEFESDPGFAALCVLVTTVASLLTLTLWLNLLA
jgi:predicted permease